MLPVPVTANAVPRAKGRSDVGREIPLAMAHVVLSLRLRAVSRLREAALVIVTAVASIVALTEFVVSLFRKNGLEYLRRG